MKLKKAQHLSISDNPLTFVGQFQVDSVFFLSRVARRSVKNLTKTRKTFQVPVPSPCQETCVDAGRFVLVRSQKSGLFHKGKLFRFDQRPLEPLRVVLSYRARAEHCLMAIKLAGSEDKKDMVLQLTPVIPAGIYTLSRIMG